MRVNLKERLTSIITAALIAGIGGGIAYVGYLALNSVPLKEYFSTERTNAIWDWKGLSYTAGELESTAQTLKRYQINTVYLDMSTVANTVGTEGLEIASEKYDARLRSYIAMMNSRGIRVFAMGGDTSWSTPSKRHIPIHLAEYVFQHNSRNPESPFTGLEYDIESYNQEGFSGASNIKKSIALSELLDTVEILATKISSHNNTNPKKQIELGFAIPYWFDNQNKNIPEVRWREKTGPILYHIMDTLNELPSANIVIMAYRNAARGNNGTIALVRNEIQYAQFKAQNVSVLVGLETTDVEPSKITFFGKTRTELAQEVKWIEDQFHDNTGYGGIAINDLAGFTALAE